MQIYNENMQKAKSITTEMEEIYAKYKGCIQGINENNVNSII